jgi:hypothetical protein
MTPRKAVRRLERDVDGIRCLPVLGFNHVDSEHFKGAEVELVDLW